MDAEPKGDGPWAISLKMVQEDSIKTRVGGGRG